MIADFAGGTHYGVYSDVRNNSGYAGYFIGRTSLGTGSSNRYLMPESAGATNQIMAIDNTGQVNFVNASTIFTDNDDQTIDNFSFNTSTNILTLEIEDDGIAAQTVDLSSLVQTDEVDWYEESTTTKPDDINDDIYTQGHVAIGKNTADYPLDIQNTSNTVTRGLNISKTDTYNTTTDDGTTSIFAHKTGNGTGRSHAIFTEVEGTGVGQKYGIFNRINSNANGNQYGTRNFLNGATSSFQFGTFNNLDNNGSGNQYGVYNGMRGANAANLYGVYNEFERAYSGVAEIVGVRNRFSNGTPGASGMNGVFTDFSTNSNGTYYGTRTEFSNSATGTGNKYGSYNLISAAAGGTHYGVYSNALSASGYAGYFLGRVSVGTTTVNNYILPSSRGANGQVMTTNGTGIVSWVTPTNGDITGVNAGTGLTGGGAANNVTINAVGSNGLSTTANDIRLGGTLIQNTTINQANQALNFNLNGNGDFNIQDDGINKLTVLDNGDTVLGGDLYWRYLNTGGAILGRFINDGDDGNLQLYENGNQSIILDANGTTIFNEQGFDRDF